ncbi:MAG: type VI secretion system baseplate subunit TssK [bacterium]|nr:type VI secretion system baseplate subunit TssK [bacterium]
MIPSVKWYMGQPLLPNHFEALQDSSRLQNFQIINSIGIPYHGINKVSIESTFLKMEVVRVTELQIITVDGQFIDIHSNAEYRDFDLSDLSENNIELFLNIYEKDIDYDFNKNKIKCHGYIVKSSACADPSAKYFIKFIELEKELNNTWTVSNKYLPSTINMNISLCTELLNHLLEISKRIIVSYERMNKDSDFILKAVELRSTLYHAYYLKFSIENIMFGNNVHPSCLYSLLYNLYIRAALYFNITPENISPYDHTKIIEIFNTLINKVDELITHKSQSTNFIRFKLFDKFYKSLDLSDKLLYANHLFFVVQKKNKEQPFDISEVKITSPSRFSVVSKLALAGIKKTKIERVPFRHYLSENSLFFKLSLGKEWDFVIKEKAITFASDEKYKDIKFYLYYF